MKEMVSIKEAANMLGVFESTLRDWDKSGMLIPVRTKGGHRRYLLKDLQRMQNEFYSDTEIHYKLFKISQIKFITPKEAETKLQSEFPNNKTSVIHDIDEIILSVDKWSVRISLDKGECGR